MSNTSMTEIFVSGLGVLAIIYFLLWGVLYLIYGKTMVVRLWQRLGPGIMVFCFLGALAGKFEERGVCDLITKGILPLGGLALMTVNLIIVARGIAQPIQRTVRGISEGADEVVDASEQISSASNTLATGAAEQAASIEETSSSLEEMAAMTQKNSENAGQADSLMKETNDAVKEAQSAMAALNTSMGEISGASEETQKIVKTIDEIAFQTNLLALNAAVEAARAGEAGAGFAVVADEVRNLAMRAAEAARNTAELIDGTVRKVEKGTKTVNWTSEIFAQVVSNSGKAGELVNEIASASSEQAQGVGQLNTAMAEMDKVVQQNAATAEEAAAATESICGQADRMRERISELSAMVFDARRERGRSARVTTGDAPSISEDRKLLPSVSGLADY